MESTTTLSVQFDLLNSASGDPVDFLPASPLMLTVGPFLRSGCSGVPSQMGMVTVELTASLAFW